MSPPAFQRAERAAEAGRPGSFVPSPDAALGDGDGAARHPYQRHGNSVQMHHCSCQLLLAAFEARFAEWHKCATFLLRFWRAGLPPAETLLGRVLRRSVTDEPEGQGRVV